MQKKLENSIPTGRHSTNYKAEAAAIEEVVALLRTPKSYNKNIVLLSDVKSVLQALYNPRNREHSNLKASLLQLGHSAHQIVLQWLPGHCNILGNIRADQLAKEGSQLKQMDGGCSYAESKTLVKAAMARKWKRDHPDSDPSDPIHGMTRSQQTIIFRLCTGHNRLRQHMYKRFKVGDPEICPCGQAPQNTEHVLQTCSSHRQLRARTWPNHTPLEKKLYGTTEDLALRWTTLWHRVSLSDSEILIETENLYDTGTNLFFLNFTFKLNTHSCFQVVHVGQCVPETRGLGALLNLINNYKKNTKR